MCFKYTVQSVLRSLRSKDSPKEGRSQAGSYYLKTPWGTPSSTWRHPIPANVGPVTGSPTLPDDEVPFSLIPAWMKPAADDEGGGETICVQGFGEVTANPLVAILNSPSEPKNIYGGIQVIRGPAGQWHGSLFEAVHSLVCSGSQPPWHLTRSGPENTGPLKPCLTPIWSSPCYFLVAILNRPTEPRAMCALNTLFSQYWGHLDPKIHPKKDVVRLGVTT